MVEVVRNRLSALEYWHTCSGPDLDDGQYQTKMKNLLDADEYLASVECLKSGSNSEPILAYKYMDHIYETELDTLNDCEKLTNRQKLVEESCKSAKAFCKSDPDNLLV